MAFFNPNTQIDAIEALMDSQDGCSQYEQQESSPVDGSGSSHSPDDSSDDDSDVVPTTGLLSQAAAAELAPNNPSLQVIIARILSDRNRNALDLDQMGVLDQFCVDSSDGMLKCGLHNEPKGLCNKARSRRDRFKDHINKHLNIMAYPCRSILCGCGQRFHASTVRDTHERTSKKKVICMNCVRKEIKIRPGFTPQEDVTRFKGSRQQQAEASALPRGHIPGWVAPSSETRAAASRGKKPTAVSTSGGGRSLEALASGTISFTGTGTASSSSSPNASTNAGSAPVSKSAKKNARRAEKKKEDKQKALEAKIKEAWDEDSDEDVAKPTTSAATSSKRTTGAGSSTNAESKDDIDDELAQKAAKLSV
ncbi:hypothetical protein FRC17_007378 [Serendipita sp. 399]|nr:hypothetical protein FRC17_007378 [Serendipita sp. 399]